MNQFPTNRPERRNTVWYLLDAKRCRFEFRESSEKPFEHTQEIQGVFQELWLEWFPGSKSAKGTKEACYTLCVSLITEAGDPILAKVGAAVPYYVLAAKLQTVRRDDIVHLRAEAVGNSCCMDVFVAEGDHWKLPPRIFINGSSAAEKVAQGTERVFSHPDYCDRNEVAGPDGGVKVFRAKETKLHLVKEAPKADRCAPVKQTHAHIPNVDVAKDKTPYDLKTGDGPTEVLGYERYMERLEMSDIDKEIFIAHCCRHRVKARHMAAAAQLAKCFTRVSALEFARTYRSGVAA